MNPNEVILIPSQVEERFIGGVTSGYTDFQGFFLPLWESDIPFRGNDIRVFTWIIFPLLVFIFIIGIVSYGAKHSALVKREFEILDEKILAFARRKQADRGVPPRWQAITDLFQSQNSSDWRLAILEADAMLDEVTRELGYQGESLGERLMGMNRDTFPALSAAWEAHKVRNKIAHQGMDFQLSSRDARRTHALFQYIFELLGKI